MINRWSKLTVYACSLAFSGTGLIAAEASVTENLTGKVIWPQEYILEIHRPHSQLTDSQAYLANVVQSLIADDLYLQRSAMTQGRLSPISIEYSVQKDHENLPKDERARLLERQPKPLVLPLKILRKTEITVDEFGCAKARENRYSLLSRISGSTHKIKLEILLCQGSEVLNNQTTTVNEQELVVGITQLINPVRARLTGDQYASLNIESDPPRASVYLDNQFLGKTPLKYSYLIPGQYQLVVKKDRFDTTNEKIMANTGETFSRKFQLTTAHAIGTLDISTDPPGAKIYLDADYMGLTPKKLEKITTGTYRVHLLHPDKGEVYKSITITDENPALKITESLSEFAYQRQPGLFGLPYKTWYWVSLTTSALCLGSAIGFYVWRDQAQEDKFIRLSGKATSLYTQDDYDYITDRNSAYNTRQSYATAFMVSAGVFAVLSIYFYVQHLLSADEGIVMRQQPKKDEGIEIRVGGAFGTAAVSASFRF